MSIIYNMELINKTLKALVNKPSYKHEYVKVINLIQGDTYDITFIEFIKTKYRQKILVILDYKLKVILPDKYKIIKY